MSDKQTLPRSARQLIVTNADALRESAYCKKDYNHRRYSLFNPIGIFMLFLSFCCLSASNQLHPVGYPRYALPFVKTCLGKKRPGGHEQYSFPFSFLKLL